MTYPLANVSAPMANASVVPYFNGFLSHSSLSSNGIPVSDVRRSDKAFSSALHKILLTQSPAARAAFPLEQLLSPKFDCEIDLREIMYEDNWSNKFLPSWLKSRTPLGQLMELEIEVMIGEKSIADVARLDPTLVARANQQAAILLGQSQEEVAATEIETSCAPFLAVTSISSLVLHNPLPLIPGLLNCLGSVQAAKLSSAATLAKVLDGVSSKLSELGTALDVSGVVDKYTRAIAEDAIAEDAKSSSLGRNVLNVAIEFADNIQIILHPIESIYQSLQDALIDAVNDSMDSFIELMSISQHINRVQIQTLNEMPAAVKKYSELGYKIANYRTPGRVELADLVERKNSLQGKIDSTTQNADEILYGIRLNIAKIQAAADQVDHLDGEIISLKTTFSSDPKAERYISEYEVDIELLYAKVDELVAENAEGLDAVSDATKVINFYKAQIEDTQSQIDAEKIVLAGSAEAKKLIDKNVQAMNTEISKLNTAFADLFKKYEAKLAASKSRGKEL